MKNFIQPGDTIDVVAPGAGLVSGEGALFGTSLFGVAVATKASGEDGVLQVTGVVEIAKLTSDVMAVGNKVNWNNSNTEVQNATSTLDDVATIVVAAGNGDTVVQVRLTPV